MEWDFRFFFNSVLLGVGLAMDAFSVSLANGLHEPTMKPPRMSLVAGTFALFQFAMPMIGWVCVHTISEAFEAFSRAVPTIALVLLSIIGGKMIVEGIRGNAAEPIRRLGFGTLLVQGIATSIDALSVGFTIAEYGAAQAFVAALVIALVTFGLCLGGLAIGKRFGTGLSGKASLLGGIILVAIGLEIFFGGML